MSIHRKLTTAAAVAALAFGLAACGGGGSGTAEAPVVPDPTPEEMQMACTDAGGRWEADGTCTSAEELAAERKSMQEMAVAEASTALQTALAAIGGTPTQAQIDAAEAALKALRDVFAAADEIRGPDRGPTANLIANANGQIAQAKETLMANLEKEEADRIAAEEEAARKKAEEDAAAAAAMAATAAKLFDGIGTAARTGTASFTTDDELDIAEVGSAPGAVNPPALEADDTMVSANNGWQGKQYSGMDEGDNPATYTAVVYSNPEAGEVQEFGTFSSLSEVQEDGEGTGEYTVTAGTTVDPNVGGSGFTHTAGEAEYELVGNERRKIISGTYMGVAGTYYCEPAAGDTCSATVATMGFTLGGGAWTFKPNSGAMIPASEDSTYLAYGWWLQKDGDDWAAGVFTATMGTPTPSASLDTLQGTAKYSGGAAGKFALSNALGGPNVAGHFTADVELEASFGSTASVSGTIDNFDTGHENDWKVSLNAANLTDAGAIEADSAADATKTATTTWEIGGEGDGTGSWSGTLYGGSATAAPTEGTGTFSAVHGRNARMIGAFGVTKE